MSRPSTGRAMATLGQYITRPNGARPDPNDQPMRLDRTQTASIPAGLFYRLRARPYDPKLIDIFLPDSLAREKGWQAYEQMLDDSQVRANNTVKQYSPLSSGYVISPADNSPLAAQIADLCRDNLNDLERPLEKMLGNDILLSTFMGLSISEMLWRYEDSGKYKGKVLFTDAQTRPPSTIDLQFDSTGKVTGVVQVGITGAWTADQDSPGLSPFKFIVHTWHGRYGSPYGRGDGRSVYRHWWAKDFLNRAWMTYMDKFGAPSLQGRASDGMSQEDSARFLEYLQAIQHQGVAVLPPNWDVQWLASPGGSANGQAFLDAIEWHDSQISKAILGSTLTTDTPTNPVGMGGAAMAGNHADTRDLILALVRQEAEDAIVRRQIMRRIVRLNYGLEVARTLTPKISFNPQDITNSTALSAIVAQLITAGVIQPTEPWIREKMYLPAWKDVQDAVQQRQLDDAKNAADVNKTKGLNPDGTFTQPPPAGAQPVDGNGKPIPPESDGE
jgi:phage gp29-like protein